MARLSGFADEVTRGDIDEQIAAFAELGIGNIAVRTAFEKNVMDLDDGEVSRIGDALKAAGMGVSEVGSPIGKTPIDAPFEATADALRRAADLAEAWSTPNIRVFSFYPPAAGGSILDHRDEVLRRLEEMCQVVKGRPVTLVLENEADLYGDKPEHCLDIFRNVQSDQLRMAFDPANFVSRQFVEVHEKAWRPLKQYVAHFHVKDHKPGANTACPAGEGDGDMKAILAELAADGYDGFLTLEPHLSEAGQFRGFTGIDKFHAATDALRKLCEQVDMPLE